MGSLRLVLALAVAAAHAPIGLVRGFGFLNAAAAVQSFFIISGFFITMVLNENPAYAKTGTFYISRYLRLYPMYIVCALVTVAFAGSNVLSFAPYGHSYLEFFQILNLPSKLFVLFSNLTIFFQDLFLFLEVNPDTGALIYSPLFSEGAKPPVYAFEWIAQGWSLDIELIFYLLAPFVARKPWRLATLVAVGFTSRIVTFFFFGRLEDPWYYRFPISEMMLFGLGGLGYHAYERARPSALTVRRAGAAGLVILLLDAGFRGFLGPFQIPFHIEFSPFMIQDPLTLLLMTLFVPVIFAFTRESRFDRLLGDLSYPVYLSHVGVAAALSSWKSVSPLTVSLSYFAITLAVGALLIVTVDRPLTRFRARHFGAHRT